MALITCPNVRSDCLSATSVKLLIIEDRKSFYLYPRERVTLTIMLSLSRINGESVLCVKSDLWLTEAGEKEGKFFFRLLKPSPE